MKSIFKKYGLEEHVEPTAEVGETDDTWLSQPDTPDHSEIGELEHISETSEEVIEQIESNPEVGLEHYQWVMANALKGIALPVPKRLGLENYMDSNNPKKEYVKNLKSFKANVDKSVTLGLEAFDESIDKTFKELLAINARQASQLKRITASTPTGIAVVDNPELINLFIRNNQIVTDVEELRDESVRISNLVKAFDAIIKVIERQKTRTAVGKFFDTILFRNSVGFEGEFLLLNRYIEFSDTGVWVEQDTVDSTKTKFALTEIELNLRALLSLGVLGTVSALTTALALAPAAVAAATGAAATGVVIGFNWLSNNVKEKLRVGKHKDMFASFSKSIAGLDRQANEFKAMNDRLRNIDEEGLNKERIPVLQKTLVELTKHINELQYVVIRIAETYKEENVKKLDDTAE